MPCEGEDLETRAITQAGHDLKVTLKVRTHRHLLSMQRHPPVRQPLNETGALHGAQHVAHG
jgi:hypothetical protein